MTKLRRIGTAVALVAFCASAPAQYALRVAPKAKVSGVTAAMLPSGLLGGADDCNSPHPALGPGDVVAEPFTTGTTGTAGQNETICSFFGTSGITNDVWYYWTADQSGSATLATCGQTGVDSKAAIWPGTAGCPADGTAIACKDDACGLQTAVAWNITFGTTYTIQLGTFPGAAGGSGTFSITQSAPPPPPCGTKDDGTTENALGLTAGGELGWIKTLDCVTNHNSVLTAYGTAMFPGSVTNGNPGQIVVYTNPTGSLSPNDPNWITQTKLDVIVANGDTDIINKYIYPMQTVPAGNSAMVLASAAHTGDTDPTGPQFPGPIDQTGGANPNAWFVGASGTGATLRTTTLSANSTPPQTLSSIGILGTWLLRIERTANGHAGTALCFGDGSGAPCGCGNESAAGSEDGCLNSLGVGANLEASGSTSLANPDLTLTASDIRSQPGLFFQANNTIGGGTGVTFGDGIRCCGGMLVRLSIEQPSGPEPATTATTITSTTGITPGDKRCYQYWYRDPGPNNPCSNASNFNLSNGVTVTWGP